MSSFGRIMINNFAQDEFSFFVFVHLRPECVASALFIVLGFLQLVQEFFEFERIQYLLFADHRVNSSLLQNYMNSR